MITEPGSVGQRSVVAAGVIVLVVTAGCQGKANPGPTTYVTVHAPQPSTAAKSSAPGGTNSTASSPPAAARSTSEHAMSRLPGPCDTTMPLGSIVDTLGHKIGGRTAFVVGTPDPTIQRISYINCRYGVSTSTTTPGIEIGVSLYRSPAKAAARIRSTIDDYEQHSATAAPATVAGMPATVLNGGVGAGYGPTIVLSAGQRTIAVTLRPGFVPGARLVKDLTALAALAAERTAAG